MGLQAVAWFVACSDSQDLHRYPAQGGLIAFGRGGAETRAAQVGGVTSNFGVSAYFCTMSATGDTTETSTDIFHQTEITTADGGQTWTYSPTKKWPVNGNEFLRFYAWWPFDAPTDGTFSGRGIHPVSFGYTNPADAARQCELLYAVTAPINHAFDYEDPTSPVPRETALPVTLRFRHALAGLRFSVRMDGSAAESYTARVHSVSVYAIHTGTFTLPAGGDKEGVWTVEREYADRTFPTTSFRLTPGHGLKAHDCTYLGCDSTAIRISKGEGWTGISADNDYLLMIPQQPPKIDLTKPTQVHSPVLTIEYQLDNGLEGDQRLYTDKTVSFSLTDRLLAEKGLATIEGTDTDPYIWEAGKTYHYQITISTSDVTLNILPTDWDRDPNFKGNEDGSIDFEFE